MKVVPEIKVDLNYVKLSIEMIGSIFNYIILNFTNENQISSSYETFASGTDNQIYESTVM